MSIDEKLDYLISNINLIKKKLNIIPDRETIISDYESNIKSYEEFARYELKIQQNTIDNQRSILLRFLNHSRGVINKHTVQSYLDTNKSDSWKSNQIKALRRYTRDFLKLGNWIEEFIFKRNHKVKIKEIPDMEQLRDFCVILPDNIQIVFLVLLTTGFRIGEVLSIRLGDINFETRMIDASNVHQGETKHSWISFVTEQTISYIDDYMYSENSGHIDDNSKLFSMSQRMVQQEFTKASQKLGFSFTPHMLRTVFSEKCGEASMKEKYIDAFCGRISQSVLAKNYTDYSPKAMKVQYAKIEQLLILDM